MSLGTLKGATLTLAAIGTGARLALRRTYHTALPSDGIAPAVPWSPALSPSRFRRRMDGRERAARPHPRSADLLAHSPPARAEAARASGPGAGGSFHCRSLNRPPPHLPKASSCRACTSARSADIALIKSPAIPTAPGSPRAERPTAGMSSGSMPTPLRSKPAQARSR